jgi:hypothetical protein
MESSLSSNISNSGDLSSTSNSNKLSISLSFKHPYQSFLMSDSSSKAWIPAQSYQQTTFVNVNDINTIS